MIEWINKKVLMLVKTYPNPSTKYHETVCTAGISSEGKLVRLYPVPFRELDDEQKFTKFCWITVDAKLNPLDKRPESFKINANSIRILNKLDATKDAYERREWIEPLISSSMEDIIEKNSLNKMSLGIFKPKFVNDFIIKESKEKEWSHKEITILNQISIFENEKGVLEKIPYDFTFNFQCDNPNCKGHQMKITDWELCQTYRNFKKIYGLKEGILKVKEKWMNMFKSQVSDAYFVVGTVHRFNTFIILGVINLKRQTQMSFNLDI